VLSGSADFSIARSTVTNSAVTNGTLLVVDITNLVAGAPGGGFDLTLTAGALKVATLEGAPADGRSGRRTAVAGLASRSVTGGAQPCPSPTASCPRFR
jgi:hypothetical protein